MEASWNLRGTLKGVNLVITVKVSIVYNFSVEGGTYFCKKYIFVSVRATAQGQTSQKRSESQRS